MKKGVNRRRIRCLFCPWFASEVLMGRRFSKDHADETGHWSYAWRRTDR